MRWICCYMGVCLLSIAPERAWSQVAEPKPKVIVLVDSGEESLHQRLRQEMESLGLEVEDASSAEADLELDAQARRLGAIAAVRVSTTGGGLVEMTIIDRATGKTVRRRLVSSTSTDPAAAELIAIRTIELLRASLMELKSPHPSRGEVPVTAQIEALAYVPEKPKTVEPKPSTVAKVPLEPPRAVTLYAGTALVVAKGWAEGVELGAGVATKVLGPVGLQGDVFVPVVSMQHRENAGKVVLDATVLRLGARYNGYYPTYDWGVVAGANVSFLSFSGQAVAPYAAKHADMTAYGGYVSGGFALHLYGRLRLRIEQSVTVLFPNTVVRFAGARVTSFGQPLGTTALTLEFGLP